MTGLCDGTVKVLTRLTRVPSVSWAIRVFDWLVSVWRVVLAPVERRLNERRARRLDRLADIYSRVRGFERQAADCRAAADMWRAGGM